MKLGISCQSIVNKFGYEKGLKMLKSAGFDAVDLNVAIHCGDDGLFHKSEDEFMTYFNNIKNICNDLELEISQTHGMLTTCVPDEEESNHI